MDVKTLYQDLHRGVMARQPGGKVYFSGPLYELDLHSKEGERYPENAPFKRIRVMPVNMTIHPLTEQPVGVEFVYRPVEEAVRVHVPIRLINEEKCHGLRNGGWPNCLLKSLEVAVAPFTVPPIYATLDIAGLGVKDRKYVRDMEFRGKEQGCRTVLKEDTLAFVVSKV